MSKVMRSIFTILVTSSAFMLGLYLGKEKIRSKISDFQEEPEDFG